jgi:predicted RND superfamily exporter protein
VEAFGVDEHVVVSWPGCTLDDQRIDSFTALLMNDDSSGLFDDVVTGPSILQDLTSGQLSLPPKDALRRVEQLFVGADQRSTCVIIHATEAGRIDRTGVLQAIHTAAASSGVAADELRIGGQAVTAVAVDETTQRSFRGLMIPAGVLSLLVAWICLRDFRMTLLVLSIAAYGACSSMALVYYTGGQMNAILIVMPVLMLVLGISGAIHLVHYYEEALAEHGQRDAVQRAMRSGWVPCALSTCTTALGLASLGISKISIIRSFGLYSAAALMLGLLVLMTVLPAVLSLWQPDPRRRGEEQRAKATSAFDGLLGWIFRSHGWLTAACLVAVLIGSLGAMRAKTAVDMERMFSPDSRLLQDHKWIEDEIGPLKSFDVVVRFGEDSERDVLERLEVVQQLETALQDLPQLGATLSVTNFVPPFPTGGGIRQILQRKALARVLDDQLQHFESQGLLAYRNGDQLWKIQVRTPTTEIISYDDLTTHLELAVADFVDGSDTADVRVELAGLTPLFHDTQEQLLADLIKSFAIAFVLITPIMMLVLRSVPAGLVAMIPNVFPALCVFGTMGWLEISIDIGSVVTASVALGIAVDDTLHFLTWYARARRQNMQPTEAIGFACKKYAKAMIQTTMVCGLGLLVFVLSDFVPISRFAMMMFVLLVTALLGDLVLLAGMLVGPCGRWIGSRPLTRKTTQPIPRVGKLPMPLAPTVPAITS